MVRTGLLADFVHRGRLLLSSGRPCYTFPRRRAGAADATGLGADSAYQSARTDDGWVDPARTRLGALDRRTLRDQTVGDPDSIVAWGRRGNDRRVSISFDVNTGSGRSATGARRSRPPGGLTGLQGASHVLRTSIAP